jgi:hypothetical protein
MSVWADWLRAMAVNLAKQKARKMYAAKCAKDLKMNQLDVERVLDWLVDKVS